MSLVRAQLARREWLQLLGVVVAIKAMVFAIDPQVRFFMWDSVTYLRGALDSDWPRDRSILYTLLIRISSLPFHSMYGLVIAQTAAGIVSAALVFFMARKLLDLRFGVAATAATLVALEPGQLFYEHMMMAEAFGSVAWLSFVALVLIYMRDPRARWLPLVALAGITAVSLRLNGTLVVITVGAFLPLWRSWLRRNSPEQIRLPGATMAVHLAVALISTGILHWSYQHLVGRLAHSPPGYIGVMGVFRLGTVAPLIQPQDFEGTGCAANVIDDDKLPLGDPTLREGQLWNAHGLWAAMQKDCPDPEHAADVVSQRALDRGWWRVPLMGFPIAAQYFDGKEAQWRMDSDLGRKDLPLEIIEPLRNVYHLDAGGIPWSDTLTSIYFGHSRWWYTACFFGLLPLAWMLSRRARRESNAALAGLALIALWVFATQFFFSHILSFRYLHPFPPLVIMISATLLTRQRSGTFSSPLSRR